MDISLDENYLVTSGNISKDLKIYNINKCKKINKIKAHSMKNSAFYFLDDNKAITLAGR